MKKILIALTSASLVAMLLIASSGSNSKNPKVAIESPNRADQHLPVNVDSAPKAEAPLKSPALKTVAKAALMEKIAESEQANLPVPTVAEPPREPAAPANEYSGKLLSQTLVPADELIRAEEGRIAEKDRVELQKADHVAVLQPPAGKKILAFQAVKAENCALLGQLQRPLALSIASDGSLEEAEYIRKSGDAVPAGLWNCRFTASGDFKDKAFMTVYVPQPR